MCEHLKKEMEKNKGIRLEGGRASGSTTKSIRMV